MLPARRKLLRHPIVAKLRTARSQPAPGSPIPCDKSAATGGLRFAVHPPQYSAPNRKFGGYGHPRICRSCPRIDSKCCHHPIRIQVGFLQHAPGFRFGDLSVQSAFLSKRAHLKPDHRARTNTALLHHESGELPRKNARMPIPVVRNQGIQALSPRRNNRRRTDRVFRSFFIC
jgi:hypothetical protein